MVGFRILSILISHATMLWYVTIVEALGALVKSLMRRALGRQKSWCVKRLFVGVSFPPIRVFFFLSRC